MKKFKRNKTLSAGKGFYVALAFIFFSVLTITIIAIKRSIASESSFKKASSSEIINRNENIKNREDVLKIIDNNSSKQDEKNKPIAAAKVEEKKEVKDVAKNEEEEKKEEDKPSLGMSYIPPIENSKIIRDFSGNKLVYFKTPNYWKTHVGVDLSAKEQTPVKVIADGKVVNIKNIEGTSGVCVEVEHDDKIKSYYEGLNQDINVKLNQHVSVGDVLGNVGKNQLEQELGPHLCFKMKKGEEWVDPKKYIKQLVPAVKKNVTQQNQD